jgi:cytosine/uracil/thiamine/allantoin permease
MKDYPYLTGLLFPAFVVTLATVVLPVIGLRYGVRRNVLSRELVFVVSIIIGLSVAGLLFTLLFVFVKVSHAS